MKSDTLEIVERVVTHLSECFLNGNKLLLIGNGGSAAESQHMAAEYINRLHKERRPLPAISLTTDTSNLTSIANDRDFSQVFSRQLEALGKSGDVLFAFSTSGKSPNILSALEAAHRIGMISVLFTGSEANKVLVPVNYKIIVPSAEVTEIQTIHTIIGHYIADSIEKIMFVE
jgi:D-sedoheptulose 7-phosphate isomerase